jgi:hypothetical protein
MVLIAVAHQAQEFSANLTGPDIIVAEIVDNLPPSPRLWRDKPSRRLLANAFGVAQVEIHGCE